jgi:hypothetical protein
MSDVPSPPLCWYVRRRYIWHKVEAKIPALRKRWAPNRAWGASGATGYRKRGLGPLGWWPVLYVVVEALLRKGKKGKA